MAFPAPRPDTDEFCHPTTRLCASAPACSGDRLRASLDILPRSHIIVTTNQGRSRERYATIVWATGFIRRPHPIWEFGCCHLRLAETIARSPVRRAIDCASIVVAM